MKRPSLAWSLLCAALLALAPRIALSNGRFPNAQRVKEISPSTLAVMGTYGLLTTTNGGSDWYLVCEQVLFGRVPPGWPIDPLFETLADGTIVSGAPNAIRVSRDNGCSWQTSHDLPVDPTFFADDARVNDAGLTVDLAPRGAGALLALVAVADDQGLVSEHRLFETSDGATSWHAVGEPIPLSSGHPLFTLDVAPSDPSRIYVSGSLGTNLVLLSTRDAGQTWVQTQIGAADPELARGAYIAAVAPDDEDKLYVRVPRWSEDIDAQTFWDDSLLFSSDGGGTWTDLLRRRGNLLGFALSPDGSRVLAGFGDPKLLGLQSEHAELGLYGASVSDHAFELLVNDLAVSCLGWTETGIFACATEEQPLSGVASDFHLGVCEGGDLPRSRADFRSLLRLENVRGVLPWSDGRPSECTSDWCSTLPACPAGGMSPATAQGAQVCDAMLVVDAGSGDAGEPIVQGRRSDGSCSCGQAGGGRAAPPFGLLALAALAARSLRRNAVAR